MQKEYEKFATSTTFEGMTSVRAILKGVDAGTNDRQITSILYDIAKTSKISKEIGYLRAVSQKYGFEVVESTTLELEKLALGNTHGGIIALAGERTIPYLEPKHIISGGFYAMIDGIEDPYNFGYSLRSLYACGCDGIILGERNWMSAAGIVCRSSAGASEMFNVYKSTDDSTIRIFKDAGYSIVCADERTDDVLGEVTIPRSILLVVGGERRGISKDMLSVADMKIKIPYAREFRASLSAASATTMFAYEIMRQRRT